MACERSQFEAIKTRWRGRKCRGCRGYEVHAQEIVGIEIDKNKIKKYLRNPENQSTSETGIQRRTHCNKQSHALQSRMCRALERDLL